MVKTQNSPQTARLKLAYTQQISKELKDELQLANIQQVPKIEKIIVSVGLGKHQSDKNFYEVVKNTITKITGQVPADKMARKSIATFKIRAGMNRIGTAVTLRGNRMYEFLDRFVNVYLPRVKDFHGVSRKSFDKDGNFNYGIIEQSIFPELTFEETQTIHGLQITIVIKNSQPERSLLLLEKIGIPFEKNGGKK